MGIAVKEKLAGRADCAEESVDRRSWQMREEASAINVTP
jgi:hypothetical protein